MININLIFINSAIFSFNYIDFLGLMYLEAFTCNINMDVCSISSCHSELRRLFECRADMTDRYVTILNGKESRNSHSMIYVILDLYSLE